MSNAGFHPAVVIEWNKDARDTLERNKRHIVPARHGWSLFGEDVKKFDYGQVSDVMLVSGGPPCQPFSMGGKHKGQLDTRDMFPEAVRAVRELRPKAFIFENVKGLMRQTFTGYFEYIILQLTHPSFTRRVDESWQEHRIRLERHHTSKRDQPEYNVVFRLLNAANYGVPQRRERVFLVGFRSDLGVEWNFPDETHSEISLLRSQWVTGDYWERHKISTRKRPQLAGRLSSRVESLRACLDLSGGYRPWQTVRDAIGDLPDPMTGFASSVPDHVFNPGARSYAGHTGSPLDEPAKTLKAGDHGVPGGENMLAHVDGSVRYFTVREAARLQTFPDSYTFCGAWTEAMRQLGNAVPVRLAEVVASSVAETLQAAGKRR
jgi:DNA (cytosine-5)-methyltransferase 1